MKNYSIIFLFFIAFLIGWESIGFFNSDYQFVLSPPSKIFSRLWSHRERFMFHSWVTLREMVLGFLLAFIMAFPLAWTMNIWKSARAVLQPVFIIVQCVPMFTLAPLMIIWFGWSSIAIIIPTALMIFFPLTINIYQGLQSTPQYLLDYFRVNHATSWQTFFKLQLPWALPHIFGGFKLAAAIAGIAAVAGEWAGAQTGLGVLMVESRRDTDLETNFAALFCLTSISCVFYSLILCSEYLYLQRAKIRRFVSKRESFFVQWRQPLKVSCLLFLILFIVVSCQKKEASEKGREIRLTLDWMPNPNHIPLYVGIEKGFFEEQGLSLLLQKLNDPGHATPYLSSGQCDIALSYMPHTIRMNKKGANFKPIGILVKEPLHALIYRENEGIKTVSDLNGKRIGYCSSGKESAFVNALLKIKRIEPSQKLNVGYDLVFSLGTKKVDALYGAYWNIEKEHLQSLGVSTHYFKLDEFNVPTYYELIFLVKEGSVYSTPEFISAFQQALQKSIRYSAQYPEEAFEIYANALPDKSEKTKEWERKAWDLTIPALADNQEFSADVWQRFSEWLDEHQIL